MKKISFLLGIVLFACQPKPITLEGDYMDSSLPIDVRVADLLSRMTLEEKVSQMEHYSPAIERLGIPEYNWWNECLHGVARSGKATVFPQAIGLAATWNESLIFDMATAISDEARAKHHYYARQEMRSIYQGLTFWSPNINIFRDPRWGRGHETYGEDPFLTGRMGLNFIRGLQGNDPKYLKLVATPKHFAVHSGPEPLRHVFDATTNEQDLHETYLPAFKLAIEEGNAQSVMCAYNRYEGEACCGSNILLKKILRDDWGFNGYVVSDCWAVKDFHANHKIVNTPAESAALGVKSGTDVNCGNTYRYLLESVAEGLITEEEIDVAVSRLFRARFMLGMFDDDEKVPYANISTDKIDCSEHRELALQTARESMVLLNNENNILPINTRKYKKIAVIGPNADNEEVQLGNYYGYPSDIVTIFEGIKNASEDVNVMYARGCFLAEGLPYFETIENSFLYTDASKNQNGLKAEYYTNRNFEGQAKYTKIDSVVAFNWWDDAPLDSLDKDDFSIRWTGVIVPPETGKYAIGGNGMETYKIYLEDTLFVKSDNEHEAANVYAFANLQKGKAYNIRIDYNDVKGHALMKFIWSVPNDNLKEEAVKLAKSSDLVVLALGLSASLEGEENGLDIDGFKGGDRTTLDLPLVQQELMKALVATGKPVVLVLQNGSALSINWASQNVPAILEAWYGGQDAGTAVADILFGKFNPAGRLPVTFYKSVDDLPDFNDYNMNGRTYRYFKGDVLYPFGYGLSYTQFTYSNLRLEKRSIGKQDSTVVSIEVTNSGHMVGDEVVQLYIRDKKRNSIIIPQKELKGFTRVSLDKGETKTISFTITPNKLAWYNVDEEKFVVDSGEFDIIIGSSSAAYQTINLIVQ